MIKINLQKTELHNGDCLEKMKLLPDNSIDSIVTDPPYGISFMGKKWDYEIPSKEVFEEMLRVLKPGAHALIACGTRTQHRMAVNIEDAGFEIRDVITWLYGSGFPKSMDVSKAIDKQAGAKRELTKEGTIKRGGLGEDWDVNSSQDRPRYDKPSTKKAKQWQGWGTALKPACEFWTLARKPLSEKTVASNVLKHGTGAINIDASRVEFKNEKDLKGATFGSQPKTSGMGTFQSYEKGVNATNVEANAKGRWPANLILDEEAAGILGEPSRFFYAAKASKSERNQGCEGLETGKLSRSNAATAGNEHEGGGFNAVHEMKNHHPTVKPIKLMSYLVKMITPPEGIVLDPFMGSGSTGVAAVEEGFGFIGIEREPTYFDICNARIKNN